MRRRRGVKKYARWVAVHATKTRFDTLFVGIVSLGLSEKSTPKGAIINIGKFGIKCLRVGTEHTNVFQLRIKLNLAAIFGKVDAKHNIVTDEIRWLRL